MELSAEDNLRLNVLLAQKLQAVRIDESKMIVYALTDKGEAKAVVAAVYAQGLTDELAGRAWWIMPTADNARRMLEKKAVVQGKTGPVLADFLIEFLPFEEDPFIMIESVRLVLQPGLISEEEKQKLWAKAKTKRNLYVGFIHALPDHLPAEATANTAYDSVVDRLQTQIDNQNPYALMLRRILSDRGQAFVHTAEAALKKPGDQQVVESLFNAIAIYFYTIRPEAFTPHDIEAICSETGCLCEAPDAEALQAVLAAMPEMKDKIQAMLIMSCLSVCLLNPVFSQTDAIGTMMRKKIQHITDPIVAQLGVLRSE
jgi:hypothetical protein